ncbi:alpha/beta fold hydrolase [Streptomyces sp. NPDC017056]|uniref:alpha/beta fold hydrolase n=1 Tax=Streptomyces sp. NPDC017056 TaxID=3364973 RepID=UPI00379F4176
MADWLLDEEYASPSGVVRWACVGQGPPVVFLHGTPFSSYIWRHVTAALSDRYCCYVWDMAGYGASQKSEGQDVSLAAQQEVFTGLMRKWGLHEPAVVAHDFGGAVALRSAVFDGMRYGRLALLDTVALRPWGTGFFRLAREHPEAFASLPGHLHEALVRAHIATASHKGLGKEAADALVLPWLGEAGQRAFYRQAALNDERFTRELEDRLGDLRLPTLIAWGREDAWLPIDHAERLKACMPHARMHVLEGAGHLVQEDAPSRLCGLLEDFLHPA